MENKPKNTRSLPLKTSQKKYYNKNKKKIYANQLEYIRGRKEQEPRYKYYLKLITRKSKLKKGIQDAIEKLNEVREYKLNNKLILLEDELSAIRKELDIKSKL